MPPLLLPRVPFCTLKNIYGFSKARYRGLVKNANRAFVLLALINLDKWGLPLINFLQISE